MSGRKITRQIGTRLSLVEDEIFDDIANGMAMMHVYKKYNCSRRAFHSWLDHKPGRKDVFDRARQGFADAIAEETLSIADSTIDPGEAQINKVRIDARKWLAGKVAPDVYGDKSQPNVQINLQSEHLRALKDINASEDGLLTDRSDSRE